MYYAYHNIFVQNGPPYKKLSSIFAAYGAPYEIQGQIGYAGTHVPMSVLRLGLIKPGQTYVCPKLWAFSIKITLWLILHFFKNRRLVCPKLWAFSELFVSSHCQ